MATEGIEGMFLATRNWGKSVAFWKALGFELEFETDHHSGQLHAASGPWIFLAEQPDPEETAIYLRVADAATCAPANPVEVVEPFAPTHWGTQIMKVRDPDGRVWSLQAPA